MKSIKRYRNTTLYEDDGILKVRLHGNLIFQEDSEERIFHVSTCGYSTHTTIKRINECLEERGYVGYRAYRKDFAPYLDTPFGTFEIPIDHMLCVNTKMKVAYNFEDII